MRLLAIYLMVIGACLPLQAQDLHSDLRTGEFRRLALKGRASAQFELGIRYEYGKPGRKTGTDSYASDSIFIQFLEFQVAQHIFEFVFDLGKQWRGGSWNCV